MVPVDTEPIGCVSFRASSREFVNELFSKAIVINISYQIPATIEIMPVYNKNVIRILLYSDRKISKPLF